MKWNQLAMRDALIDGFDEIGAIMRNDVLGDYDCPRISFFVHEEGSDVIEVTPIIDPEAETLPPLEDRFDIDVHAIEVRSLLADGLGGVQCHNETLAAFAGVCRARLMKLGFHVVPNVDDLF